MINEDKTVAPCVHLNGTSKATLLENLEKVYQTLQLAYDDLKQAAPNGRDYYIGTVTLAQAQTQHSLRQFHLENLIASIETEIGLITNGRQRTERGEVLATT